MEKYKGLFLEESRDHLSALSRLLLSLEQDRTPHAEDLNEVFRHLHSLKGMAAAMGFGAMADLAHRAEDLVDVYRGQPTKLTPAQVDVLLRGVDHLQAQLAAVENDEPIPSDPELVALLERSREPSPGEATALSRSVGAPSAETEGTWLEIELSPTCPSPAARAFLILRTLRRGHEVLAVEPPEDELRRGVLPEGRLRVRLEDHIEAASVRSALQDEGEIQRLHLNGRAILERVDEARGAPPEKGQVPEPSKMPMSVRVRVPLLDGLADTVGDLFIARERLRLQLGERLSPDARAALDALGARIHDLHRQVMQMRMMPLSIVTERYPRLVRDLAQELGKKVTLELEGMEIELDRSVLEHLDGPLVHVLRNALDHGIEPPEERAARGKNEVANVVLGARRDRDAVLLEVRDDGRGLDVDLIKKRACEKGLVSPAQAEAMSAREAYFLICEPGFSTKESVSAVSGRGVGMDAVRAQVEALGGSLDIESELGHGTIFRLRLPLTLAIVYVFVARVGSQRLALPVTKMLGVRSLDEDVIREAGGRRHLSFQHALVPVIELGRHLRLTEHEGRQAIVVEDGRDMAALAVDHIEGYREVVVKALGEPLDGLGWFSGAAVIGDGEPVLLVDIAHAMRVGID